MSAPAATKPADDAHRLFFPIALALIGVGTFARLGGIFLFRDTEVGAFLIDQSVVGLGLHAVGLLLALRGLPEVGACISGVDFVRLSVLTPRFGTGSELYLYALVLPFVIFPIVKLRLWLRATLAALPIAGFLVLRFAADVPLTTGLLDEHRLRILATLNVGVFTTLSFGIAVYAWALAQAARARAERLASARTRLVDDMSHELRTPLAVLLTAAQGALKKDRSGEAYQEVLRLVERQARSLGKMVELMLEMGRVERAELEIHVDDDLATAVAAIVDEHRPLAATRGVELDLEVAPIVARTDADALRIVLGNLLQNAIRFSPERGKVEIRLGEDGSGRRLSVTDHGPGIPPDHLPLVFQRYWRADPARSRRHGHYGLGLPLARRYAAHLGAAIEAESELGKGATFTVRWTH